MLNLIIKTGKRVRRFIESFDPDNPYFQSQAGQDRFVLNKIYRKRKYGGFFIEMGAADGVLLSNTYVLEKRYDWTGILVEPSHRYSALVKNRTATCVRACVGDGSRGIFLLELPGGLYLAQDASNTLRSVAIPADRMEDAKAMVPRILEREGISPNQKNEFPLVQVDSISLTELLDKHGAPKIIDYFSLDVEGHEDEVFRGFEFDRYQFNVLNVETPSDWLRHCLSDHGYVEIAHNGVGDIFYRHQSFRIPFEP